MDDCVVLVVNICVHFFSVIQPNSCHQSYNKPSGVHHRGTSSMRDGCSWAHTSGDAKLRTHSRLQTLSDRQMNNSLRNVSKQYLLDRQTEKRTDIDIMMNGQTVYNIQHCKGKHAVREWTMRVRWYKPTHLWRQTETYQTLIEISLGDVHRNKRITQFYNHFIWGVLLQLPKLTSLCCRSAGTNLLSAVLGHWKKQNRITNTAHTWTRDASCSYRSIIHNHFLAHFPGLTALTR